MEEKSKLRLPGRSTANVLFFEKLEPVQLEYPPDLEKAVSLVLLQDGESPGELLDGFDRVLLILGKLARLLFPLLLQSLQLLLIVGEV